jgi:hypothetical protein
MLWVVPACKTSRFQNVGAHVSAATTPLSQPQVQPLPVSPPKLNLLASPASPAPEQINDKRQNFENHLTDS